MRYTQLNIAIFLWFSSQFSLMNVIEAVKTEDPFYIIAHMANNRETLDWAVSQGANAIESDFQFNDDGYPSVVEHGWPCDCICSHEDSICRNGLHGRCEGSEASDNAAAHVRHVAQLDGVALFIIDSKIKAELRSQLVKAGNTIIYFLDENLFKYGYKGKIIIASSKIYTSSYIQAAVQAANNSPNRDHYFFTFDGEGDNYQKVISALSKYTNRRVYGTGITACMHETFYTAIENSIIGKNNRKHGMTYIWTLDKESSMRDYIDRGVQGIVTNRIALAKRVAVSMGLTMAKVSTSIPVAKLPTSFGLGCDCHYHEGGCRISWPAPSGRACRCHSKGWWSCYGYVVDCDDSLSKCLNPDTSQEACRLGGGSCHGYFREWSNSNYN